MKNALQYLAQELNNSLKNHFGLSDDLVVIGRLKTIDGSIPLRNQNKLILSMINVSLDHATMSNDARMGFAARGKMSNDATLNLNTSVLLASTHDSELEGLTFLDRAIQYFQVNSVFNQANHPDLPDSIHKITLEPHNVSFRELESVWSTVGTPYVPSILYHIRILETNELSETDIPVK